MADKIQVTFNRKAALVKLRTKRTELEHKIHDMLDEMTIQRRAQNLEAAQSTIANLQEELNRAKVALNEVKAITLTESRKEMQKRFEQRDIPNTVSPHRQVYGLATNLEDVKSTIETLELINEDDMTSSTVEAFRIGSLVR